jgi:large subunit ribosomal protein L6
MKLDITEKVKILEEVNVDIDGNVMKVKGPKGSNEKRVFHPKVKIEKKENSIILTSKKATKKDKTILNTLKAHIKNLIKGVKEGYEYQLKICSGHFPMNVSVKDNQLIINNFFGEKKPRKVRILEGAEVKIEGDIIKVNGLDIDTVSQTASRIELTTKRNGFDKRIFQDGIWIIKKGK